MSHLERMSGAAKEAAAAVSDVTDAAARDAFLVTWRERLSSSAKAWRHRRHDGRVDPVFRETPT